MSSSTINVGRFGFMSVFFVASLMVCQQGLALQTSEKVDGQNKIARVFILAGQSNMVGHGVVDLDDPQDYNSGKGTLVEAMKNPASQHLFSHLRDKNGKWIVRDDTFVWYQAKNDLKVGGLTIGFTGYEGQPHHIGPEFQFGHVVGDAFEEPVLLIKTAWGGKSLQKDFRPPSSGGSVGPYYIQMLRQIGVAMENAPKKIPALQGRELVISGFVWQQGWNDMVSESATSEYETNLLNLISDVRKQFLTPDLPFVFGELGNGGDVVSEQMKRFRSAQAAVGKVAGAGVSFVKTARFARPAENSPNQGHGHHWFGNAESYFLVGDALGHAMVRQVCGDADRPRILILGDSISIGYTPFVQERLSKTAFVVRPMRKNSKNGKMSPENCAGTDNGIKNIDRWLRIKGGDWDVIHFNFGLHDLKHVNGETGKNSMNLEDPLQSSPADYERQLREIIAKLKETNATLIFGTTTPVPQGCKPLRETTAPEVYNNIAKKIAAQNGVKINDLYTHANQQLEKIQRPANVHFTTDGSKYLADQVVKSIEAVLNR
ncbi:MAG: sialate O-acetylesterase [Mariniblastus sp.]|nr:sialate O-acetylesterase [Mariniblastus sp.]